MKIKLFTNSGIFDRDIILDGFTMSGFLTLLRNPSVSKEAATMQYVDNFPYLLSVDDIYGGIVAFKKFGNGWGGDIELYNGTDLKLKTIMQPAAFSKYTVNAKGQVVDGIGVAEDNAPPTLAFGEIYSRPYTAGGLIPNPERYASPLPTVISEFTGNVSLYRDPTSNTELSTQRYLNNMVLQTSSTHKVGQLAVKPNTLTNSTFLRANGAWLDKTTYALLYAAIGDTYNGSGTVGGTGFVGQPWSNQYSFNTTQTSDLGAFTNVGTLPSALSYFAAAVTKNRVYVFSTYVHTAVINANGTLGGWSSAGTLPRSGGMVTHAFVTKNKLYVIGIGEYTQTFYAPINADGTLGAWANGPTLPQDASYSGIVFTKDQVYVLGNTRNTNIYRSFISSDGTLGAWSFYGNLPALRFSAGVINTGTTVYLAGGSNGGMCRAEVYAAPINADGSIGSWYQTTSLPERFADSHTAVTKNKVYLIMGNNDVGPTSYILTSGINANGNLTGWYRLNSGLTGNQAGQIVITNSRLYIMGGTQFEGAIVSTGFGGGSNDYMTLIANNTLPANQFKLPDLSSKKDGIYEYYIKATL